MIKLDFVCNVQMNLVFVAVFRFADILMNLLEC